MPTIQSLDLPKPKDWQEFETIVRDAQAQRWSSVNLQKNGRQGQRQHGVDIYGPDNIGRPTGIQCKRYKQKLTLKLVQKEIENAEKFVGRLNTLYVATTNDHDSTLQQEVRMLSDKRVAKGNFAVAILFWDEIVSSLVLNPNVFKSHYPQFEPLAVMTVRPELKLAALELGYRGGELWNYIELVYGEYGWLANADPDELIADLRVLEMHAGKVLPNDDAEPLITALRLVRDGCQAEKERQSDWHPVEFQAKRFEKRLRKAVSLLPLGEANALELGTELSRIYHHFDNRPTMNVRNLIEDQVRAVLSTECNDKIEKTFRSVQKLKDGYKWAMRIYGFVNHELRYQP